MSTGLTTIHASEIPISDPENDYLHAIWDAFKRHRVAAFLVFALIFGLAAAVLLTATPRYSATATIMIEARSPQVVRMDSVLAAPSTDQDAMSSEIQILQSRDLVGMVARELDLDKIPEFDPNKPGRLRAAALAWADRFLPRKVDAQIRSEFERPVLTGPAYENAVVDLVRRNLSVTAVGRSRAIDITFSSVDPTLAQKFAQTLAWRYIEDQTMRKQQAAEDANRRITEKLSGLQQAAAEAASRAAVFRAASGLMQGRDSTLIRQQISETNTALTSAISDRVAAESRLHEIERAMRHPARAASAQVLDSRTIQELLIEQARLGAAIAPLAHELGANNPRLAAAKLQMEDIKRRIDVEAKNVAAAVKGDYDGAVERERELNDQLDKLKREMAKVQESEVHLGQLEQNAQAARNIYEVFLNRAKETAADGSVQVADARVISSATKPLRPYFPNLRLALPVSGFMGLALAFMTTLVMEARAGGIRSQIEAERLIGLPTLGMMPIFKNSSQVEPYSMIGSAISDLYMRFALSPSCRSVVVTSALPREGKTTLGLCLARIAGRSGKKTVLLDCDLRRCGLSERLSLSKELGISDVLQGTVIVDSVMAADEVVPEVSIVSCGRPTANPAGLLASERMKELLSTLKREFDLIVIDTAPMMAAPETMAIAAAADETLLFVRWSSTPKAAVTAAHRKLRNAGAKVAGLVLTMVDVRRISKYSVVDGISYSKEVRRYYSRESRT